MLTWRKTVNPYTFLVGAARSGTTLLKRIVDTHPQIAITPESHWISRYVKEGLVPEGRVTPDIIDRLLDDRFFKQLDVGRDELEMIASGPGVEYVAFVRGIFDLYARRRNRPLAGDKTPSYVRSIQTLHELFPDVRFVHIIRDGRDVAMSVLDWPKGPRVVGRFATWSDDPVTTCALWWEWSVRRGREAGKALPPRLYHELRYEELVSKPEDVCATLCQFLDLPYDQGMLRFHVGRTKLKPGLNAKRAWLPVTPGLRNWAQQMRPEDAEASKPWPAT